MICSFTVKIKEESSWIRRGEVFMRKRLEKDEILIRVGPNLPPKRERHSGDGLRLRLDLEEL